MHPWIIARNTIMSLIESTDRAGGKGHQTAPHLSGTEERGLDVFHDTLLLWLGSFRRIPPRHHVPESSRGGGRRGCLARGPPRGERARVEGTCSGPVRLREASQAGSGPLHFSNPCHYFTAVAGPSVGGASAMLVVESRFCPSVYFAPLTTSSRPQMSKLTRDATN